LFHFFSLLIATNGLALGAGGDLEALNCQPAPKQNRSTNLQVCKSPPIVANSCWLLWKLNQS